MNKTRSEGPPPAEEAGPRRRLDEVLEVVRVELVNAGLGGDERRGFDPYNGRLGRTNRDIWGGRKRA